jgi:hypothetical protein
MPTCPNWTNWTSSSVEKDRLRRGAFVERVFLSIAIGLRSTLLATVAQRHAERQRNAHQHTRCHERGISGHIALTVTWEIRHVVTVERDLQADRVDSRIGGTQQIAWPADARCVRREERWLDRETTGIAEDTALFDACFARRLQCRQVQNHLCDETETLT